MFVFGLFLLGLTRVSAFDLDAAEFSHVVVIPDIHGDSLALLRSLWLAVKEVDKDQPVPDFTEMTRAFESFVALRDYTGPQFSVKKNVALVQLGDVLDRGPNGMESLCILAGIEKVIGWKTVQLYGNHEILNFVNLADRYVGEKEKKRFELLSLDRSALFATGGTIRSFITDRSVGMVRLVAPGNAGTLFVHAGVDLAWLEQNLGIYDGDVEAVNMAIKAMADSDEAHRLNNEKSILWTRDLAQQPEPAACILVDQILERFNVHRIVVGHTPQSDFSAKTRCGGRIVLTDVMMSRWMVTSAVDESSNSGGRPVAVIMKINREGNLESMDAHYTDLNGFRQEKVSLETRAPTAMTDDLDVDMFNLAEFDSFVETEFLQGHDTLLDPFAAFKYL
jgi:hypothetical protein